MLASKLIRGAAGGDKYVEYETILTSSGTWTVPYTQTYNVYVCGAGGWGGNGGSGTEYGLTAYYTGGGGGGGGSGAYTAGQVRLTAGTVIPITIGSSAFGTSGDAWYMAAGAGYSGGNGGAAYSKKVSTTVQWRPGDAGYGRAGGSVTAAGNLASVAGRAGSNGSMGTSGESSSISVSGGYGGASVFSYKGRSYGAGGRGGNGSVSGSSGSSGGTGVVIIVAVEV